MPPLFQQNASYNADDLRQLVELAALGPGVPTPADVVVSQRAAGANMSVDVAVGRCLVDTTNGLYLVDVPAVVNLPLSAAPGAGSERYDLIAVRVRDSQYAGVDDDGAPLVVEGTPAATGTASVPATPTNHEAIASVYVGPSVATILDANITDRRRYARPVTVDADLAALPPSNTAGQLATDAAAGMAIGDGAGGWTFPLNPHAHVADVDGTLVGGTPAADVEWAMAVGTVTIGFLSGGGDLPLPVTFTGIAAVAIWPVVNTRALTVTRRTTTGGATNGVVTGNNLPLYAHTADAGAFSGNLPLTYMVLGWL